MHSKSCKYVLKKMEKMTKTYKKKWHRRCQNPELRLIPTTMTNTIICSIFQTLILDNGDNSGYFIFE